MKKFKGKDYVRKHIMNKHVEKVNHVKKEVLDLFLVVIFSGSQDPALTHFSRLSNKLPLASYNFVITIMKWLGNSM